MSDQSLLYKLALKLTPKVGAVTARTLISYCGSAEAVFSSKRSHLSRIPGVGPAIVSSVMSPNNLKAAERELELISRYNINVLFYLDSGYPERLRTVPTSPILLYTKGTMDLNVPRMIAVVGTRRPTVYGRTICQKLVEGLSDLGATIVSGLAYGIDVEAHRTALNCHGPTIGVMGSGLGSIYPSAHRKVALAMCESGGLLTEFEYATKPEKDNFPARNRIVAALTDAVLVVESGKSGGSIITAEFANTFHRDVFAVPGRIGDAMSEGCNSLIHQHKAHIIGSVDDIARMMSWQKGETEALPRQGALFADLTDLEQLVFETLDTMDEVHIDVLSRRSNLHIGQISSVLLSLECKGIVKSLPGKRYLKMP